MTTRKQFSRKEFISLSLFGLLGMALPSVHFNQERSRATRALEPGLIGRIASDDKQINIHRSPDRESAVVREIDFDELVNLYYQLEGTNSKGEPERWYRVWGGYLPGTYVQPTRYHLNPQITQIPECGKLAEITVPYTESYTIKGPDRWEPQYRLYYQTTHWVTGAEIGPDEEVWYQITSQLYDQFTYHVPAKHVRLISESEYLPTSIQIPPEKKLVKVSLQDQTLTAYEDNQVVYQTRISSGLGEEEVSLKNPDASATPRGEFRVTSKYPSKHMGLVVATGAPGSYTLPGVPWTTFFVYETGVAFHGTYWHNNFGTKMSHGCVNMRNVDAKWLFRWVNPPYEPPYRNHCEWYQTGRGTRILIE